MTKMSQVLFLFSIFFLFYFFELVFLFVTFVTDIIQKKMRNTVKKIETKKTKQKGNLITRPIFSEWQMNTNNVTNEWFFYQPGISSDVTSKDNHNEDCDATYYIKVPPKGGKFIHLEESRCLTV